MWKVLLTVLIAAGLFGDVGVVRAGTKTPGSKEAHLGIGVGWVPPALYSQMPDLLAKGQGVLVEQVAKDSPAAKAGMQPNDILTTFDDQKIYAPEQLIKLIHADKPGQVVALGFVRAGKSMACKVTLGEAEPATTHEHGRVFRFLPDHRLRNMFEEFEAKSENGVWESFDAIKLTRTDAKHWNADVEYRSKDGNKVSKHYTGTREDIRKSIEGEKNLPANERSQLLHALNLHAPAFEFHFPALPLDSGRFNQP